MRTMRVAAAAVALAATWWVASAADTPARADDKPRTVTFVNTSDRDVSVHVRVGSSGEQGSCEAKSSETTFELSGKNKDSRQVDSQGETVCWCSRPASEGPINERRDCEHKWQRASGGQQVNVQ